jgi:hypothetical protein
MDTRVFMLVMAANVIKELNIIHLVVGQETYKTTSRIVTQALGRITELPMKVGRIIC